MPAKYNQIKNMGERRTHGRQRLTTSPHCSTVHEHVFPLLSSSSRMSVPYAPSMPAHMRAFMMSAPGAHPGALYATTRLSCPPAMKRFVFDDSRMTNFFCLSLLIYFYHQLDNLNRPVHHIVGRNCVRGARCNHARSGPSVLCVLFPDDAIVYTRLLRSIPSDGQLT